jgi:predicted Fe-Mo cluster-binding NifX family protein
MPIHVKGADKDQRHGNSIVLFTMKTIGITEWNDLISPLFDAACRLLIVRPDGKRSAISVRALSLNEKTDRCMQEGVDVVICGAISNIARMLLEGRGIRVLSWVSGPIETVLDSFMNGGDVTTLFAMPGCRHHGRRAKRFGQCRRHVQTNAPANQSPPKKERLI